MTAPELTTEQRRRVEEFEAAEYPAEVAAYFGGLSATAHYYVERARRKMLDAGEDPDRPVYAAALAARRPATEAEAALTEALRAHHPTMRSETGPFSGCRCGEVKLGEDVIRHVVDRLRRALNPAAEGAGRG